MNLNEELEQVKNAETNPAYINKPGALLVKITGYEVSDDLKDYSGNPYIEWKVVDADGRIANIRMYRAKSEDSEEAKAFKHKQLKEFLENAGADFKLKNKEFLNSVKNKKLKVLFREEEYLGKEKDNNDKPVVRTAIRYGWSAPEDGSLGAKESHLFKELNEYSKTEYQKRLAAWEDAYGNNETRPEKDDQALNSNEDDDDLPF